MFSPKELFFMTTIVFKVIFSMIKFFVTTSLIYPIIVMMIFNYTNQNTNNFTYYFFITISMIPMIVKVINWIKKPRKVRGWKNG